HWPSTYLEARAWKTRLLGSRTLELTWESDASGALAGGGLSMGDAFGWREPQLPPGRARQIADAVDRWTAERSRVVLASDQAPRGAATRRRRPDRAQPQRRLRRRPGRARLRHGPRAVRHGSRSPAAGASARRPARHPRAPDARRPRRPHRPRHRPLRADAPS